MERCIMKLNRTQLRKIITEVLSEMAHRVPDRNPGMSAREKMEIGDYGSDDPYYTSEPFEDEPPVLSPEEEEEKKRREIERMRAEAEARRRYRRIMGDYGDVFDY
jgi:hypothetical protein